MTIYKYQCENSDCRRMSFVMTIEKDDMEAKEEAVVLLPCPYCDEKSFLKEVPSNLVATHLGVYTQDAQKED